MPTKRMSSSAIKIKLVIFTESSSKEILRSTPVPALSKTMPRTLVTTRSYDGVFCLVFTYALVVAAWKPAMGRQHWSSISVTARHLLVELAEASRVRAQGCGLVVVLVHEVWVWVEATVAHWFRIDRQCLRTCTWNDHRTTHRSFLVYSQRQGRSP